jgi:RHS repeat-associated protein
MLIRIFSFLILVLATSLAEADDQKDRLGIPSYPIALTEGLPSSTVNGCVDAISGIYFDHEVDLIVPGPEPILVERYYASTLPRGWRDNVSSSFFLEPQDFDKGKGRYKTMFARYFEPTAHTVDCYGGTSNRKEKLSVQVDFNKTKGITNCGRGEISGKTNLKNIRIHYDSNPKNHNATITDGANEEKTFKERCNSFFISSLKRSNGNKLEYTYDKNVPYLVSKVKASSPSNLSFGHVEYHHLPEKQFEKNLSLDIVGSDGRKVNYKYILFEDKKNERHLYLQSVQKPSAPNVTYEYEKIPKTNLAKVAFKRWDGGEFIGIKYYPAQKNNPKIDLRVESISAPVGHDEKPVETHHFTYNFNKDDSGSTTVKDLANIVTRYDYSNEQRLNCIYKSYNNGPHTIQYFYWHTKGTHQGNLASSTLQDGNNQLLYVHGYVYDDAGNILKETVRGNLTGNNFEMPGVNPDGSLQNKSDAYTVTRTYNQKNCVLSSTDGDGTEITYTYDPKNNLPSAKYFWEHGLIKLREFYYYDSNAVLIKSILDDGKTQNAEDLTGVTERHLTYITPKAQTPCLGFPEIIQEMYLDLTTGQEKLLSKKVNAYSPEGFLIKQDIFDSENRFQYSLVKQYDSMGNPTMETDPLGQIINRKFDRNGNCIYEQGPRVDFSKRFTYDRMNRLIKVEEIFADENLVTTHSYNTLNQKVCTHDPFGNITSYSYDPLGNLVQITQPPVVDENGSLVTPTQKFFYNVLGQCVEATNAKGQITRTSFTIQGKPYLIKHPDGTQETHLYSTSGLLLQSTTPTGITIKYHYDYLKRPTKIDTYGADGTLLTTLENRYNAFHLTESIDPSGHTTQHRYDFAGRPIAIQKEDSLVTFEYDSLGRVSCKKEWYSEEGYTLFKFEYDLLNRLLEETILDNAENILRKKNYAYDVDNNQTQVIEWTLNGLAITTKEYDPYKRLIKIIDPQGEICKIDYNYHAKNDHGQNVLQKISTDPFGQKTITTYDTHGRETLIQKQNPFGLLIAKQETFYDVLGNSCRIVDTILPKGNEITTLFEYDSGNRLVSLTEAWGTADQKCTCHSYNNLGQKESTTKPDGTLIQFTYDALGRLEHFFSQDSFDYIYSYDNNNNVVSVTDQKLHQTTRRLYDNHDRIIHEELGTGFVVQYRYDRQGRPLAITLPDSSEILYRYDALSLREVQRGNRSHFYTDYDLAGNVLKSELCGELGSLNLQYDLSNRPTSLASPYWTQDSLDYDSVGNLVELQTEDHLGNRVKNTYSYDDWYQLKAEHGTSHHHYKNDSLCNRVEKNKKEYSHNFLNQLLEDGENRFVYDLSGNLSEQINSNTKVEYVYDALDRLIAVKSPKQTVEYTYDSFNRRLSKKISSGKITYFIYQGQNEIGSIENGKFTTLRVLGKGQGAEIGAAILIELNGKPYIPLHDHRGNVTCLVDATTKTICERYLYSSFGEEKIFDGAGAPLPSSENPWRFSSKRTDPETNFIYFGRRYYSPTVGRWTTQDPLGLAAGPNLYAYVHNSPLTHIDLYGLDWVRVGGNYVSQRLFNNSRYYGYRNNRHRYGPQPSPFNLLGRAGATAFRHICPIPYVQQGVISAFHFIAGNGLNWSPIHSKIIPYQEQPHSRIGAFYTNGMNVSEAESIEQTNFISKSFKHPVIGNYNSDHGTVANLIDCVREKMDFLTPITSQTIKLMKSELSRVGQNGIVIAFGMSEGCMINSNASSYLSPNERKRILFYNYGGAKVVPNNGNFKEVSNKISSNDGVGLHIGRNMSSRNDNSVTFIRPYYPYPIDHTFFQTYGNEIIADVKNIRIKHREYFE